MNILQVNFLDNRGGAARIARSLHDAYPNYGHNAWMVVGHRLSNDERVYHLNYNRYVQETKIAKLYGYSRAVLRRLAGYDLDTLVSRLSKLRVGFNNSLGHENYYNPNTKHILKLSPQIPDLIHAHNLHESFFDLKYIPRLSRQLPFVMTLHDTWTFTGHCAHYIECSRWKTGCGQCPDLSRPVALEKDGTRYNLNRKMRIYSKSHLYVVTPSRWLMSDVRESVLMEGARCSQVIPNGIDLKTFYPDDKAKARDVLHLPKDAVVLLYVVSGAIKNNRWKDYETIQKALELLRQSMKGEQEILFVGIGSEDHREVYGNLEIRLIPYEKSPEAIAQYYRAADVYLHAAHIDNYPTVILEALACGTPVIATDVGGISEQIIEGKTGFLIPRGDAEALAKNIRQLATNPILRQRLAEAAAQDAEKRFGLERMARAYLDFYQQALSDWKCLGTKLQ